MTALHLVETRAASLARFYADPREFRVSIRRAHQGWFAFFGFRGCGSAMAFHARPRAAVALAIRRAEALGIVIDRGLGCTYPHPFGAAGVAARGHR